MHSSRLAMEASGWSMIAERFQRLGRGVQLAQPAVDQHQAGQRRFSRCSRE